MKQSANKTHPQSAFTLLEVLIVLFILGMIAAMAGPAMGILDDAQRARITRERMAAVRRAILGPDDRFDTHGRPLIGGYAGDMQAWPDLWEARAEIKPDFTGSGWDTPSSLTAGLGQGPDYTVDPGHVFFRPSGHFTKSRWHWNIPYRRLYDDTTTDSDHIGGLATENEGQPRGLWTRFPEELNVDLTDHAAPGLDLGENWKGPYIAPPLRDNPSDSDHWAENDGMYDNLAPAWQTSGAHAGYETWEEGDYAPAGELGELFDDKEAFRLLQTEGRLTDGWGRALRFFITDDADHAGSTVFWILSEGPDGDGRYPTKGSCSGHVWTVDAADTMATAYDPDADKNQDNIVLKLFSRDWEAIFEEETRRREALTDAILEHIRRALAGESPGGLNSGYTGAFCAWPALFRWEDNGTPDDETDDHWDNADDADIAYTKGQPRGLWTATPNTDDTDDDLAASRWGIGWRHACLTRPGGVGEEESVRDAWGREILFFHDAANGLLLVLSRGADGGFDFGTTNAARTEPEDFVEVVDVTGYDPTTVVNADNRYAVIAENDWQPGFFRLSGFTVLNAYLGDVAYGTTKACFFRSDGTPVADIDLLAPTALTDEDGDLVADDWSRGDGTAADPAFNYDDTTPQTALSGARYLVFWNDADGSDTIDSGEDFTALIYTVTASAGSGQYEPVQVDTADFQPLP